MSHLILFYDDYCIFCNFWVRKLCQWDRKDQIRFAPLDSAPAIEMRKATGFDSTTVDSIICWDQKSPPQIESAAVLMICQKLGGVFSIVTLFAVLPNSFLNWVYKVIASHRYQWFGKLKDCPLPKPQYRHKFLQK